MINSVPPHSNLASTPMHLPVLEALLVAISQDSKTSAPLFELVEENPICSASYLAH
jgi:hypothetical protein